MVCKAFSFHYLFYSMKASFTSCVATFENAFHKTRKMEKSCVFNRFGVGVDVKRSAGVNHGKVFDLTPARRMHQKVSAFQLARHIDESVKSVENAQQLVCSAALRFWPIGDPIPEPTTGPVARFAPNLGVVLRDRFSSALVSDSQPIGLKFFHTK